jgi:hypothetical protein
MNSLSTVVASLHLVYPPFTNQEAIWLEDDKPTEEVLRKSDFYMIAVRAEAKFIFAEDESISNTDAILVHGRLSTGTAHDDFVLDIELLLKGIEAKVPEGESIFVDVGEKIIRISAGDVQLDYFTTEKLIYQRALGRPGISGLDNVRDFATYELLYIGIAKKTDTFQRLMKNAHKKRQDILGNESPRLSGARVTDEVVLLAFAIDHFGIRTVDSEVGIPSLNADASQAFSRAVTADAEKAFVHLLDPKYNKEKYPSYPHGLDGLYGLELGSYVYSLNENLTLTTETESFHGATNAMFDGNEFVRASDQSADRISVRGDTVVIIKGVPKDNN